LRRQCQKEFVYRFCRQKLPKQCRAALVEKRLYRRLRLKQLQNCVRSNAAVTRIQCIYLNGA